MSAERPAPSDPLRDKTQPSHVGDRAVIMTLFEQQGEAIEAGSDRPISLAEDGAWLVEAGQVDVFSVPTGWRTEPGIRSHLFRVAAGRLLFGLGVGSATATRTLLAVGTLGTQLRRIPQHVLNERARDATGNAEMLELLDAWIEMLCAGISRDVIPKRCAELDVGTEIRIDKPAVVRPRSPVCWIRHVEGHSYLLGRDALKVNGSGYTPVSRRAWLETRERSRFEILDTPAMASKFTMWEGLARLHTLVLRYAELMAEQIEAADRDRLHRRVAAADSVFGSACARLAATMQPAGAGLRPGLGVTPDAPGGWQEAFFEACRIVGEARAIRIKPYPTSANAPHPKDPLAALARASRIRTRRVALRETWWQHDHGPLLGSVEADNRSVALLPTRRGYVLHDPTRHERHPVTEAVAHTLHPFAYTFYRPFPDTALRISDVVRHGLHHCGRELAVVVGMGVGAALLGMVPAMATGVLFNTVIPGAERSQLAQMTLVLITCAIATAMFQITRSIAILRIEARMGSAIQSAVWDRLLSLPMPFFRPYTAGDLAVRAMGIDAIRQVVSGTTVTAILGGIFSLFNVALMFRYSATLAWRASLLILAAMIVTALGSWLQLGHQRVVLALETKSQGLVLQLLSSIAKLRVAGAEQQAFALWAHRFSEQRERQFKARRIGNGVSAFNAAFPIAAYAVLFWTSLPMLQSGTMLRTGDFLAFLSAYGSCQGALIGTFAAILSTLTIVPLYEQAKPILETRPEVDPAKSDPGALAGDIAIQHATFRYQADGAQVLRDLTLHVRAGEFVALVGPSGSGKSTILRLLLGFEALESGAIYYDGQELSGIDVQAVRRQIGVVLQNGRLMSGDIFTNIAGSAPVSIDDAWEAARMAGFADDVRAMPMGMHTVISEGGGTLSGGQRQRLLVARAIVHRPRILFFDEATSALDNRTQAIVSASLEHLNATRLVVAHRLSTIMNADRICVIDRGQITQSGRYEELIVQDGLFADLARRQLA